MLEGDSEQAQFDVFQDAAGLLLGRKNYEGFAQVWPSMAGDGRWADRLNPMRKWVASTSLRGPLDWNATLLDDGDVAAQVRALKSELDGDLVSSGLGSFARYLVEHDLVDELLLFVPSVQGAGERPFHGASVELELLEARRFDSGVALLRYRPRSSS